MTLHNNTVRRISILHLTRVFIYNITLVFTLLSASLVCASPIEDVVLALENWTSFHWGKDCLIWVLHYSDEIVEPWTDAEAAKANFNSAQKDEYRKAFISELRMDEAEPFLVSIYAFGSSPLVLKPFAEHISLVNSDGDKSKPVSYERVFDETISGMVQGLVFFPKQSNKDFTITLKGTGVFGERVFSFQNQNVSVNYSPPVIASQPKQEELIIIDMPAAVRPDKKEDKLNENNYVPPVIIEDRPTIENLTVSLDKDINVKPEPDKSNLYITKEKTLQNFINSWIANDTRAMYDMLSDETRKMYSSESFEKEIKKSNDFRRGLLSGYKIDWIGEERAKVTTTKKLLVMRTLVSRALGVVRMGKEWRIVW